MRFALPCLALLALACRPSEPIARVPFEGPGHLIFVPVVVDASDAGWWVLDSGFEYSVVNQQIGRAHV